MIGVRVLSVVLVLSVFPAVVFDARASPVAVGPAQPMWATAQTSVGFARASSAKPSDIVITINRGVLRFGTWRVSPGTGSLAVAESALGPYSRCAGAFNHAVAYWDPIGASAEFWALGGPTPRGCASGFLVLDTFRCASRRCITATGLRVGDTLSKLRRLYPRASAHHDRGESAYWLLTTREAEGGGVRPFLYVTVRHAAVSAIVVRPQLEGV